MNLSLILSFGALVLSLLTILVLVAFAKYRMPGLTLAAASGGEIKVDLKLDTADLRTEIESLGTDMGRRMREVAEEAIAEHMAPGGLLREGPTNADTLSVETRFRIVEINGKKFIDGIDLVDPQRFSLVPEPEDTRPFGIGPGGMVGPPGTMFDPRIAMFIPDPQTRPEGSEGER